MPLSFLFAQHGVLFPCLQQGSFLACFPMALRCSASAGNIFPMVHPFRQIACLAGACCRTRFPLSSTVPPASNSAKAPLPAALPDGSLPQCRHPLRHGTPGQQHLPDGSSLQRPCQQSSVPTVPCLQQLRHSASASNSFATAPLPATNLIWRRRVLRFG